MSAPFREYVTGIAFNLTLSKPMCDGLAFFVREYSVRGKPGLIPLVHIPGIATAQSLERRGLIERKYPEGRRDSNLIIAGRWDVTEAGFKVFDLLVLAGLCENIDEARGVAA